MEEPVTLIIEKEDVLAAESKQLIDMGVRSQKYDMVGKASLPWYATYEQRLRQFCGQAEFLHLYMVDDLQGAETGLISAIGKICFLFELARRLHYDPKHFMDYVDQYAQTAMTIIDGFTFKEEQERNLLQLLQNCIIHLFSMNQELLQEEKEEPDETI